MKTGPETEVESEVRPDAVIATFGDARLVRVEDQIELQGGSMSDRMEALEWMSLMMPKEMVRLKT